jgi:hypothetical protein
MTMVLTALITVQPAFAAATWDNNPSGYEHGIKVWIGGQDYWFKGPGSMLGVTDVPGHTWVQGDSSDQVVGRHYNLGPYGAGASWWANGEPDKVLLYKVHGIIDAPPSQLSTKRTAKLKKQGYVHYHELIYASGPMQGQESQNYVVYLKHTAVRSFYFDSPPMPGAAHQVKPGVDYAFMPNW